MAMLHHFIFNCQAKLIKRHPFSLKWPYIVVTFSEDRGYISLHYLAVPIPPLARQPVISEMNIIKNNDVCRVAHPPTHPTLKEKKIKVLLIWSLQFASLAVDLHTVLQCGSLWAGVSSLFCTNWLSDSRANTSKRWKVSLLGALSFKTLTSCHWSHGIMDFWAHYLIRKWNHETVFKLQTAHAWKSVAVATSKTNLGKPCSRQLKTNQQHSDVSDLAARWVHGKTYEPNLKRTKNRIYLETIAQAKGIMFEFIFSISWTHRIDFIVSDFMPFKINKVRASFYCYLTIVKHLEVKRGIPFR